MHSKNNTTSVSQSTINNLFSVNIPEVAVSINISEAFSTGPSLLSLYVEQIAGLWAFCAAATFIGMILMGKVA